jgi:hypothetical protein
MRPHHVPLVLALIVGAWLLPGAAQAGSKLATLAVKGMVCRA